MPNLWNIPNKTNVKNITNTYMQKCRYEIRRRETQRIKELSTIIDETEPTGYEKGEPMPTSQEITIKEPPEKLTGELATIEMEKGLTEYSQASTRP